MDLLTSISSKGSVTLVNLISTAEKAGGETVAKTETQVDRESSCNSE